MQGWHTTFLGMRGLPRDISDFEMKAFFTFDGAERDAINARRGDSHKLGLALHIGFLRMSGRLLGAFRVIPVALWRHLGNELGIAAPEVASLRAMYERGRTLFDHQQVACTVLGFQWMSEHQRRSLVRELRDEVARCADRDQLLVRARQWLYKNKLVIVHERAIRTLIAAALAQLEVETGTAIAASVDPATLDRWRASVSELRPDGQTQQSWLWAAPAKHSTRQISEVLERIDLLYTLDVHKHLADIPDLILRRYARRLVSRPPSAGAKIKEPARTVEVACFLRYCLFTTTDQLILMVQRRIADLWRQAAADVPATVNWAAMYKTLLGELVALSAQGAVPDAELRARLEALITETQKRKPPSRASLVREGLIDGIRPVRSLLVAIAKLPWQATGEHPAIEYLAKLQALYLKGSRKLPVEVVAPSLGMIWQVSISSPDRERAFQALEVATLFALRRAVRNGSVWIEHSLSFRGRARLFFTDERWQAESKKHYARLSLPSKAATFLKPLLARVTAGVDAVAAAARSGVLRVDDELHLSPLPAEDEDPEVTKLRAALDHRIGEVQLPEVILAVDAQVRFSWIMLGREPRSTDELLMVSKGLKSPMAIYKAIEDEAEYLSVQVEWVDAIPLIASIDWLTAAVIASKVGFEIPALPDVEILLTQRSLRSLGRVTIGAEWGYDMHELSLPYERWVRVLKGETLSIEQPYWYEGQRFTGEWSFDGIGGLVVGYDDGGVGWDGKLGGLDVIEGPKLDEVDLARLALSAVESDGE